MMTRIMLNLQEVKTDDSRSQQDVSHVELDTVWTSATPSIQSVRGFQSVF
jgi:hypothetical protein